MRKYMLKIVYKNGDIKEYYCDYYTRKNGLLTYHIKSNRIDYTYSIPYGLIDEWTAFRVHSDKKQTPKSDESKITIELDTKLVNEISLLYWKMTDKPNKDKSAEELEAQKILAHISCLCDR